MARIGGPYASMPPHHGTAAVGLLLGYICQHRRLPRHTESPSPAWCLKFTEAPFLPPLDACLGAFSTALYVYRKAAYIQARTQGWQPISRHEPRAILGTRSGCALPVALRAHCRCLNTQPVVDVGRAGGVDAGNHSATFA